MFFAGGACRLQPVQAQARDDGCQVRRRRPQVGRLRREVPQPRILNDVFRIARAAEHPVRDREQPRPVGLKEIDVGHRPAVFRLSRPVASGFSRTRRQFGTAKSGALRVANRHR
jgi:hypothetical protein